VIKKVPTDLHRFIQKTAELKAQGQKFKVQAFSSSSQGERTEEKEQGLKVVEICKKYGSILLVFILVTIGWMVFRCDSFGQFWGMLAGLATPGHFFASWALTAVLPIGIMLFKELMDEEGWNIHLLHSDNWAVKAISVGLLIVFIVYMGELEGAKFIYFQF
jgi:hypothetical protein